MYDGFRCYMVYSSKDIIGPITPTLAAPSFSNVQSCHAEVGTIRFAESLKKDPKKGKMICTRWTYSKELNSWRLTDGIPCTTCIKFMKKKKIKRLYVSSENGLHEIDINEAEKKSKPSTGLLYGK